MAKFRIYALEVKKISKGPNKDAEYILACIKDANYFYAKPMKVTIFDTEQIALMKPYIPKSKGGLLDGEELQLPDEAKYLYGGMYKYIPPKELRPFIRLCTTTDASRGWIAGEPYIQKGKTEPDLLYSMTIFCQYNPFVETTTMDNGEIEQKFLQGEDPESKGQTIFRTMYMSYNEWRIKKGLAPQNSVFDSNVNEDPEDPEGGIPPVPENQQIPPAPPTDEPVYTDPASGRKYTMRNGQAVWL